MPKELIVLCDGTADSPEADKGSTATNVQFLRNILGSGLPGQRQAWFDPTQGWEIDQYQLSEKTRLVYYDRGLGSPKLDSQGKVLQWSWLPTSFFKDAQLIYNKFSETDAQVDGSGIIDNVAQAYNFLVQNYEPGDQIYLFGFSRGAYTLRLLVTMIRYMGLIDKNKYASVAAIQAAIEFGFSVYDQNLHPDDNLAMIEFRENCYAHEQIIHFLGLWDTVRGMIAETVHNDAKISSAVKISRHALSIDEQRAIFKPEVWVTKKADDSQQVWFAGVHSDIGGGYKERGLANITLHWMVTEAIKYGLEIAPEILQAQEFTPDPLAMQNDSLHAKVQADLDLTWAILAGAYRRPIAQMAQTESLHASVIARYGKTVKKDSKDIFYQPSNLTHTLVAYRNSMKSPDASMLQIISQLNLPDPDTLSDVGEDTSLIRASHEMS